MRPAPSVTGPSGAVGQIFTRAVTDLGGALEAVTPSAEYREKLPEDSRPGYDALFARSSVLHCLPFTESTPESPMPIRRTADVAAYARGARRPGCW
jgi:hypothetical protein